MAGLTLTCPGHDALKLVRKSPHNPDSDHQQLTDKSLVLRSFRSRPASIQKHLPRGSKPSRHAPRRFRDLFGIAGEANTKMAFAAGTEGPTRRRADAGLVDESQRKRAGIGKAVDREEEIERRLRLEEANASGL